jgi:hypothetical protein
MNMKRRKLKKLFFCLCKSIKLHQRLLIRKDQGWNSLPGAYRNFRHSPGLHLADKSKKTKPEQCKKPLNKETCQAAFDFLVAQAIQLMYSSWRVVCSYKARRTYINLKTASKKVAAEVHMLSTAMAHPG